MHHLYPVEPTLPTPQTVCWHGAMPEQPHPRRGGHNCPGGVPPLWKSMQEGTGLSRESGLTQQRSQNGRREHPWAIASHNWETERTKQSPWDEYCVCDRTSYPADQKRKSSQMLKDHWQGPSSNRMQKPNAWKVQCFSRIDVDISNQSLNWLDISILSVCRSVCLSRLLSSPLISSNLI